MRLGGAALIFGAGNGIGREIALALTDQGLDSLLCTDIDAQGLHETLLQCRKRQNAQGRADPIRAKPVDVRDEESIQRAIDGAIFLGGRVDYFVNAAGVEYGPSVRKLLSAMTLQEYRAANELHNIAPFLCLRKVLEVMLQQEPRALPIPGRSSATPTRQPCRGSIVILSSPAGEGAMVDVGAYTAAKHAVRGLVQTAAPSDIDSNHQAIESARKRIRVNAVAPTFVASPKMDGFLNENAEFKAAVLGDMAMGRLIEPEEVADAVIFLLSRSASCTDGQTLVLDGGSTLQLANRPFTD